MKHKKYLCIIALWIVACTACAAPTNTIQAYQDRPENYNVDGMYRDSIESSETEILTDESMTAFFHDLYGLKSLLKHDVYWNGQVLQMDYHFSQEVTASEIDAARSFVLNKFVMGIHNKNAISSYEHWMREDGAIRSIPQVVSNIVVEEQLLIQDEYQSGQPNGCYENSEIFLQARAATMVGEEAFKDRLKEMKLSDVKLQKSLISSALLLSIEVSGLPPVRKLDEIEAYIMATLVPENGQYERVVLSLSQNGKRIFASDYYVDGGASQFGQGETK